MSLYVALMSTACNMIIRNRKLHRVLTIVFPAKLMAAAITRYLRVLNTGKFLKNFSKFLKKSFLTDLLYVCIRYKQFANVVSLNQVIMKVSWKNAK